MFSFGMKVETPFKTRGSTLMVAPDMELERRLVSPIKVLRDETRGDLMVRDDEPSARSRDGVWRDMLGE